MTVGVAPGLRVRRPTTRAAGGADVKVGPRPDACVPWPDPAPWCEAGPWARPPRLFVPLSGIVSRQSGGRWWVGWVSVLTSPRLDVSGDHSSRRSRSARGFTDRTSRKGASGTTGWPCGPGGLCAPGSAEARRAAPHPPAEGAGRDAGTALAACPGGASCVRCALRAEWRDGLQRRGLCVAHAAAVVRSGLGPC